MTMITTKTRRQLLCTQLLRMYRYKSRTYLSTIVMKTKMTFLPSGRTSYTHRAGSCVNQCLLLQCSSLSESMWTTRDKSQQCNRLLSQVNVIVSEAFFYLHYSISLMIKYLWRPFSKFSKEKQLI